MEQAASWARVEAGARASSSGPPLHVPRGTGSERRVCPRRLAHRGHSLLTSCSTWNGGWRERLSEQRRFSTMTCSQAGHVPRGTSTGSAWEPPALAHPSDVSGSMSPRHLAAPCGTDRPLSCARSRPLRVPMSPAPRARRWHRAWESPPLNPATHQRLLLLRMEPWRARATEPTRSSTATCFRRPPVPRGTTEAIACERATPTQQGHAPAPPSCSTWNHGAHRVRTSRTHSARPRTRASFLFHVDPKRSSRTNEPHPLSKATHQRLLLFHVEPRRPSRTNESHPLSKATHPRLLLFHVEPRRPSRADESHPLSETTHQRLLPVPRGTVRAAHEPTVLTQRAHALAPASPGTLKELATRRLRSTCLPVRPLPVQREEAWARA